MRWRCYRRGGAWGAAFREQASCPSNPQRTGTGVQEYRGPRVMVFVFVAAASYAAGPTWVIGGLGVGRSACVAVAFYTALGAVRGSSSAMRWRCYTRGGAWGATRRDNVSCPNNPQRTGAGVQEYRGPRVMVFVFVAAASYAAGRGRGPRGAMRWRRYKRGGARVSRSAFVAAASYAAGRGRGSSSAMRWRCYRREGSWVAAPSLSPLFGTISPSPTTRVP